MRWRYRMRAWRRRTVERMHRMRRGYPLRCVIHGHDTIKVPYKESSGFIHSWVCGVDGCDWTNQYDGPIHPMCRCVWEPADGPVGT